MCGIKIITHIQKRAKKNLTARAKLINRNRVTDDSDFGNTR